MARYYFHLRDGQDVLLDPEGGELDGLDKARDQALRPARSILAAEVLEGRVRCTCGSMWRMARARSSTGCPSPTRSR